MLEYDHRWDILYLNLRAPPPAVSVDINGEIWARVIPETGEIVGFEIEDFERRFLVHHPDFVAAWRAAGRRRFFGLLPQAQPQVFLRKMLGLFKSIVAEQAT